MSKAAKSKGWWAAIMHWWRGLKTIKYGERAELGVGKANVLKAMIPLGQDRPHEAAYLTGLLTSTEHRERNEILTKMARVLPLLLRYQIDRRDKDGDHWTGHLDEFINGKYWRGDCDDLAITSGEWFAQWGLPNKLSHLIVVKYYDGGKSWGRPSWDWHMVHGIEVNGKMFIIDTLAKKVISLSDYPEIEVIFAHRYDMPWNQWHKVVLSKGKKK